MWQIIKKYTPTATADVVRTDNRNVGQDVTIKEILQAVPIAQKQLKRLSDVLKYSPFTLYDLYQCLADNIKYEIDPGNYQFIRLPSNLVKYKTGDCKSVALFVAALVLNLGFGACIRFVSYDDTRSVSHVYVVIDTGGAKIPFDVCLQMVSPGGVMYAKEKKYNYKKDFYLK